jgi:hypothetical protein
MAVSRHLLTTQTNQVLQQIRTVGLDAQDFEWEDSDSNVRLRHVPSGSYFWFDGDLRYCYYSPGLNKRTENRQTPLGWPSQFSCVGEWLGCLRREVETPDLWGALRQERELVDASISDRGQPPLHSCRAGADRAEPPGGPGLRLEERSVHRRAVGGAQLALGLPGVGLDPRRPEGLDQSRRRHPHEIVVFAALPGETARELFRVAGQALRWLLRGQGLLP